MGGISRLCISECGFCKEFQAQEAIYGSLDEFMDEQVSLLLKLPFHQDSVGSTLLCKLFLSSKFITIL